MSSIKSRQKWVANQMLEGHQWFPVSLKVIPVFHKVQKRRIKVVFPRDTVREEGKSVARAEKKTIHL